MTVMKYLIPLLLVALGLTGCSYNQVGYKVGKALTGCGNWEEVKAFHYGTSSELDRIVEVYAPTNVSTYYNNGGSSQFSTSNPAMYYWARKRQMRYYSE